MTEPDRIVHILKAGQALCQQPHLAGVPKNWPDRDYWVGEKDAAKATCKLCNTAQEQAEK